MVCSTYLYLFMVIRGMVYHCGTHIFPIYPIESHLHIDIH